MADNVHKNHRERMRQRAAREGFSSFADHELLEYLLYHSIPRMDTNPTAHALLEEFGSLQAVMDASRDELCRVKGIGAGSALLFDLMIEFMRRYEAQYYKQPRNFKTLEEVVSYLRPRFLGTNVEQVYLMLFNNRMGLIDCVLLSRGAVNCSEASIRKITEIVLNKNVSSVILAHNHPNGLTVPSSDDITLTDTLFAHLGMLDIVMIEHLLFAGMNYLPIMKQRVGLFRTSPVTRRMETDFYKVFYESENEDYIMPPFFYQPTEEELTAAIENAKEMNASRPGMIMNDKDKQ